MPQVSRTNEGVRKKVGYRNALHLKTRSTYLIREIKRYGLFMVIILCTSAYYMLKMLLRHEATSTDYFVRMYDKTELIQRSSTQKTMLNLEGGTEILTQTLTYHF